MSWMIRCYFIVLELRVIDYLWLGSMSKENICRKASVKGSLPIHDHCESHEDIKIAPMSNSDKKISSTSEMAKRIQNKMKIRKRSTRAN